MFTDIEVKSQGRTSKGSNAFSLFTVNPRHRSHCQEPLKDSKECNLLQMLMFWKKCPLGVISTVYLGMEMRGGLRHVRWKARGQPSQQISSPPSLHTAHSSSLQWIYGKRHAGQTYTSLQMPQMLCWSIPPCLWLSLPGGEMRSWRILAFLHSSPPSSH